MKLIAITGPDGSGKSTACTSVVSALNRKHGDGYAAHATVWDSLISSGAFEKGAVTRYLASLEGGARTLFILHGMMNSVSLAAKKGAQVILADGYFYKYAVSELAYGVEPRVVEGACAGFAKPALTLFLEVDPATALKRKTGVSDYEGGGDRAKFIAFQEKMNQHWTELEKKLGPWKHLPILAPDALANQILSEIEVLG